jgi:hypothetical protein
MSSGRQPGACKDSQIHPENMSESNLVDIKDVLSWIGKLRCSSLLSTQLPGCTFQDGGITHQRFLAAKAVMDAQWQSRHTWVSDS